MSKPDKLILDYSKWRCGDSGPNKLGEGSTALLNDKGFMCCLGQWCRQLGASDQELLDFGEPQEIKTIIPIFATEMKYQDEEFDEETGQYKTIEINDGAASTFLSLSAITINDNRSTSPDQKIEQLRSLLLDEGIELEVINKPIN